jgi:protein gp37
VPTGIAWTDETWNPIVGCSIRSPGCKHCYAMRDAGTRLAGTPKYAGLTEPSNTGPVWTGDIRLWEPILDQPLRWSRPRRIFVNSMGDLFHEHVPFDWIDNTMGVVVLCPQHEFQILTKREDVLLKWVEQARARPAPVECVASLYVDHPRLAEKWPFDQARAIGVGTRPWPPHNVLLGVSIEDQRHANLRGPALRRLHDAGWRTMVSIEPQLGPISLAKAGLTGAFGEPYMDWVIIGGESGDDARPFDTGWARDLIAECREAGIPCFVKQLGSHPVEDCAPPLRLRDKKGGDPDEWPVDLRVREFPA